MTKTIAMDPRWLHMIAASAFLLASMPAYSHIYPQGIVNKIWPMELVAGESDVPSGPAPSA